MKRKAIALIMAAAMIFTGCGSSKTETANTPGSRISGTGNGWRSFSSSAGNGRGGGSLRKV